MGSTFVPPAVFSSNGDDSDRPGKRQRLYHDTNDANGQPMDVDDVDMYNFDVAAAKPKHIDKDPLSFIPGMYRLLDLISEQSSGGTVDKIIIDQHSLKSFINDARPGAYHSLTKVDFKSLDQLSLKPLGVYGPKHEIANFLHNLGVLNHDKLLQIVKSDAHVGLRSGLYLVKPISVSSPTHVIYWPEETTWNDNCASSVRRNRITFMRYLSKVADQTVCLIPPEHARTFVWKEDADDIIVVDIEDGSFDRMYTFEVSKTNEQEENVQMRTGFEMPSKAIHPPSTDLPADFTLDPSVFLPRLLVGETNQAFLSVSYTPPSENTRNIVDENHNSLKLKSLVEAAGLVSISANADEETVEILVEHGLQKHYGQSVIAWRERKATLRKDVDIWREDELRNVKEANAKQEQSIHAMTERAILGKILDKFPTLDKEKILPALGSEEEEAILKGRLETFVTQHSAYKVALDAIKVEKITHKHFLSLKRRIVGTKAFLDSEQGLSEDDRKAFIDVMVSHVPLEESLATSSGFMGMLKNAFSPAKPLKVQQLTELADAVPDGQFAASLDEYRQVEPRLNDFIDEAMGLILTHARDMIIKRSKAPAAKAMQTLQDVCKVQVIRDIASRRERSERESRLHLLEEIEKANKDQACRLHIDSVGKKNGYSHNTVYIVNASTTQRTDPMLTYAIHLLHISQEDQQRLQMDANFIPSPSINERLNHTFSLPVGHRVLYLHSLDKEKFLLVLDDCRDGVSIYLERGSSLQNAVTYQRPKKLIRYDKIEKDLVFAYDERKRMLLICAQNMLQLHLFCFDETFSGLQGWGSAVNLLAWYQPGVSIAHACFVLGNEEVFLLDSSGQGRVFSLVAQQFRPATLFLNKVPEFVYPSPDGACLFLVDTQDDETLVHAYHWSAFGSNEPITHVLPFTPTGPLLLTSITSRNSIHLVGLDLQRQVARSHLFNITTKVTEFQFKEHNSRKTVTQDHRTAHNSLIDCHADVWTRFPVVAAIQHHITGVSKAQKRLIFATDRDFENYVPHFNSLVQDFEQTTRKPTENCLKDIQISSTPLRDIHKELKQLSVSQFHLGEWIVGFLCLIPIHIAITRENRFLPLKDGVVSPEWEKSLLGAEVGKIVDSVSLGWYESIFQSYMAHKPVKVVSSMGEQSVGKSYSLNHFVDSSFAGSAMRTTEGVWLSCTPTDDALIVALDFEGVHSIERSAQEDTLLVLFNTALSNLVLFRNNFALSRDITGLFQSFQSSSTVLDPAANPSLFQSTLVIIIKDVVESDKDEIVKEFSLKFQKIVQEEQDANFISRLHAGRLNIVPWPVIESKNFYTLFQILRKRLDQQKITHPAAGQFLLTLKTLMAKLKANDWGSISQTLVAHRAQRLTALLPTALMYGLAEIEPQEESLKNFDTDEIIHLDDEWEHPSVFLWLEAASTGNGRDLAMLKLCQSWPNYFKRDDLPEAEWLDGLTKYLQGLVNARVRLVRAWIQSNLSRFTASHASISDLWREFEKLQVDLKAGVELCRMKCSTCHLLCVGNRRHDADAPHDCKTSHMCPRTCDYSQDHQDEEKQCGYPAGHTGGHICTVDTHLCGKPCRLKDKRGCLGECTQVVGHDGDHNCPSKVHSCGQPCSLQGVTLPGGKKYSCSDTCMISSEQEHEDHVCDSRMCPVTCEQCNRLCSDADHLHALDRSSIHLCGQEHSCSALCAAPGSCEIETAPQSIKATFTGQHETFEYTKYSQVAKRLKCAIVIPPGERTHKGHHVHTTDPTRVHFCETRCEFCGYYCTLPLGHPQQLHETSHGSMSKSQWVVDGPAGTMMEVDGHKFGSEDDGAPMMCNLVCTNLGRHPHMDYCRTQDGPCGGPDTQHVARNIRFNPNPDREKDWISHSLFWRRTGFKDPYSRDDQANFAKCDAMCAGPEHKGNVNTPAQPSYCTLPLFHPPETTNRNVQLGYRSHDGHVFPCKNPAVLQQAFHVIFVVDRSGSMSYSDRRPLTNTPVSAQIQRSHNDRLGAVYSALHSFWTSRHAAVTGQGAAVASRRDAYSVILFDHTISTVITNDFASDPQTLLNAVLRYGAAGGTNFELALGAASTVMRQHWSSERTPVVVFLSDGECSLPDLKVQDLCRTAVSLGKPLSLHTVSFGSSNEVLRRMARIALDIQKNTPVDPNAPANSRIDSSFSEALDSVQLASTFMSIAESLRKPRGALMHT